MFLKELHLCTKMEGDFYFDRYCTKDYDDFCVSNYSMLWDAFDYSTLWDALDYSTLWDALDYSTLWNAFDYSTLWDALDFSSTQYNTTIYYVLNNIW